MGMAIMEWPHQDCEKWCGALQMVSEFDFSPLDSILLPITDLVALAGSISMDILTSYSICLEDSLESLFHANFDQNKKSDQP